MEDESITPSVGMGVTLFGWSDSYACTIIKVLNSGRKLIIQKDKATLLNGLDSGAKDALTKNDSGLVCGIQRYQFALNKEGETFVVTQRKVRDGYQWKQLGTKVGQVAGTVSVNERVHHYDYNFTRR